MSPDELRPAPPPDARAEVEGLIPHRAPFLFVDEIVERAPGALRVAWTVPPDADFLRGHYPGRPVTPGVILCEHAFQAGALLVSLALGGFDAADGVPVLTRARDARFKRIVEPGERVETAVEVEDREGPAWYLRAEVRCGGSRVLVLRFVLSATDAMARVGRGEASA